MDDDSEIDSDPDSDSEELDMTSVRIDEWRMNNEEDYSGGEIEDIQKDLDSLSGKIELKLLTFLLIL